MYFLTAEWVGFRFVETQTWAENFFLKPHRHRENIAFEIEKLMEFKN